MKIYKIQNGVVEGFKKMEEGAVGAYKKAEDKFDKFLTRDGGSPDDAKKRLAEEKPARECAAKEAAERRAAAHPDGANNVGKASAEAIKKTEKNDNTCPAPPIRFTALSQKKRRAKPNVRFCAALPFVFQDASPARPFFRTSRGTRHTSHQSVI